MSSNPVETIDKRADRRGNKTLTSYRSFKGQNLKDLDTQQDQLMSRESDEKDAIEGVSMPSHLDDVMFIPNLFLSTNITSNIMLRIPTHCLPRLRAAFDEQDGSFNLIQFLQIFVRNMTLEDEDALLGIVPDLVDLFNQVDINGDGHMEWSEFVMFVIEQVTMETTYSVTEKLQFIGHQSFPHIIPSPIHCSKVIDDIKRSLVCVDDQIYIYRVDKQSPSYLSVNGSIKLTQILSGLPRKNNQTTSSYSIKSKAKETDEATDLSTKGPVVKDARLTVNDLAYLSSKDYLFILRSDFAIEVLKLTSRAKFSPETIIFITIEKLSRPYNKIALRDVPNGMSLKPYVGSYLLFGISSSKCVDYWELSFDVNGGIEFRNKKSLCDHTDYIRDMLVIHTPTYRYLVTCSMDKTVILYDLHTLDIFAVRTGHTLGVQCLAFDNKSILLAGGYDHSIIGWDLDTAINRPIFHLTGHESVIYKIVALGDVNKCFSLDNSGVIKYWDTNILSNYNDHQSRVIDTIKVPEDRIKGFDVLQHVGNDMNVLHDCVLACQGRQQHSYKATDVTVFESAPIAVLYSHVLFLVISVHMRDIIFWNIISGQETKRMSNIVASNAEICCAVLDDRERKLILGDSLGNITVYNCLTGVVLKTFPPLPYAVRTMIYSDDKTVVALAGQGDIFVFDELPNDPDADVSLRDVKSLDCDVVSIAYYHHLNLIATADIMGTVTIYNYEQLSIVAMIPDVLKGKTDLGQITFLEPLPLLLVTDSLNNFTIIPVGPAVDRHGKKVWRVDTAVALEEPYNERAIETGMLSMSPKTTFLDPLRHRKERLNMFSIIRESLSDGQESDDDDEEMNDEDIQYNKPFNQKKKHEYMLNKRDVKSVSIHMIGQDELLHQHNKNHICEDEPDERIYDRINKLLEEVRLKSKRRSSMQSKINGQPKRQTSSEIPLESSRLSSMSPRDIDNGLNTSRANTASNGDMKSKCSFPSDMQVFVICGYDDGTVSVTEITSALAFIDVGLLQPKQYEDKKRAYDPRKLMQRQIKDADVAAATWHWSAIHSTAYFAQHPSIKKKPIIKEEYCRCTLENVWQAHSGAVNSLKLLGDDKDILTIGEDKCIKLWTFDGLGKATLTRGRELDKLFKPRWISPIDISSRTKHRIREAKILASKLKLRCHKLISPKHKMQLTNEGFNEEILEACDNASAASMASFYRRQSSLIIGSDESSHSFNIQNKSGSSIAEGRKNSEHSLLSTSVNSLESYENADEPERFLVLGQLFGRITYKQTKKEATMNNLMAKYSKRIKDIEDMKGIHSSRFWKNKKKKKKSGEAEYLDQIMVDDYSIATGIDSSRSLEDSELLSQATGQSNFSLLKRRIKEHHYQGNANKSKFRSRYDVEIDRLNAEDPNNWDITSKNLQRQLYKHYFLEIEKYKGIRDPMAKYVEALNALCPNNDFEAFVRLIRHHRGEAKAALAHQNSQDTVNTSNTIEFEAPIALEPLGINVTTSLMTTTARIESQTPSIREEIGKISIENSLEREPQEQSASPMSRKDDLDDVKSSEGVHGVSAGITVDISDLNRQRKDSLSFKTSPSKVLSPRKYANADDRSMSAKYGENSKKNEILKPVTDKTRDHTQQSTSDSITKANRSPKRVHDQLLSDGQLYASLLPLPVTKIESTSEEMKEERRSRQELLLAFEADVKRTERYVKEARKQRKKEKRQYKKQIEQQRAMELALGNSFLYNPLSPSQSLPSLPVRMTKRHAAATLKLSKSSGKLVTIENSIADSTQDEPSMSAFERTLSKIEMDMDRKLKITTSQLDIIEKKIVPKI